jgi:peptidoglycan/LPS O-acetylase OafA/YrhL
VNSRNCALDALRGIAILMVLFCHYLLALNPHSGVGNTLGRGVDLFFVLSGFLISGLLFSEFKRNGSIDVKRFWIRRGFKIYPAFYVFTFTTIAFWIGIFHNFPKPIIADLLFVQSYWPNIWHYTWSLAVEEHFYLILPLILLLLIYVGKGKSNPFRALPLISIAVCALCLYGRIHSYLRWHDWDHTAYPTHLRIDALFSGVTLGYYAHFDPESFHEAGRKWVLAIGLTLTAGLFMMPGVPQLTFAFMAFSFILPWVVNQPNRRIWVIDPLLWAGRYSYSIYLWQGIGMLTVGHLPPRWFRLPLYLVISITPGVLMSKLVEIPALKLRDRLFPSRSSRRVDARALTAAHAPIVPSRRGVRTADLML